MYRPILPNNTHFISPCNEYRGLNDDETRDQYVERLAEELENKILELGSDTVAGFYMEPVVGAVSHASLSSCSVIKDF
jgi:adenosylmethionine-8-amino-7-oxononanoate aminotransferase